MSTSFITIDGEHGFWIDDGLTQVCCWGMVFVIDQSEDADMLWMKGEYREYLYDCSQGIFVGFTNLRLYEYLVNDQRKLSFGNIIERTKAYFINKGNVIPVDELNSFQSVKETMSLWISPLKVSRILKVLDYLTQVVQGVLVVKVSDKIDYDF